MDKGISRRSFLVCAGATSIALAVPQSGKPRVIPDKWRPGIVRRGLAPMRNRSIFEALLGSSAQFVDDQGDLVGSQYPIPDDWWHFHEHTARIMGGITCHCWPGPACVLDGFALVRGSGILVSQRGLFGERGASACLGNTVGMVSILIEFDRTWPATKLMAET